LRGKFKFSGRGTFAPTTGSPLYVTFSAVTGKDKKASLILSVVISIEGAKVAISTYKRKYQEVTGKIKKADGIVYLKDNGGSPTNGE
jgi:hypothetical protein